MARMARIKTFPSVESVKSVAQILSRKQEVDREWHTASPHDRVEQAARSAGQLYVVLDTRLCWSAARRPEMDMTDCSSVADPLPSVPIDLPPGQWSGRTGEAGRARSFLKIEGGVGGA
jgi:hypothetical protein